VCSKELQQIQPEWPNDCSYIDIQYLRSLKAAAAKGHKKATEELDIQTKLSAAFH